MDGLIYYIAAAVLWAGFAAQLPGLWHHRRDPLKRALCAVIFLAGGCFALGAPSTIAAINRLTGVPNAAAPVTYAALNAFSAFSLVLIVHWRGGDPDRIRRLSRGWLATYTVVIAVQLVLFAAGDAPFERRTTFDTYYATTPYIREMIALYLVAHMAAAFTTTILCWRWTRHITGWTRTALTLLALGWLCTSTYGVAKLVAVAARWTGHDWAALSTRLAPLLVAIGSALIAAGYIVPLLGPRLDSALALLRLGPLYRLLVGESGKRYQVALSWRSLGDVELQLTQRTTAIHDGLKRLSAHFDPQVRARAYDMAIAGSHSPAEAEAMGAAAMVAVAAFSATPRPEPHTTPTGPNRAAIEAVAALTGPANSDPYADRPTLDTDQNSLIRLSQAVGAPIVDAAVRAQRAEKQDA
ncbi:MAB_1171c family putative transporter [Streptomyces ureilyticus]|uniref:DUF6545 domain-containing protein n=1 Tax=Streptomyces ureilyticus TaxID=1775131 RepID=A0ABX0DZ42_9ACTN|nr:MAB_1171c family putative transporter [Streptomyces ureilyticus]NGO47217.1 hypothetical protein [Streptomyces ureilyticus]